MNNSITTLFTFAVAISFASICQAHVAELKSCDTRDPQFIRIYYSQSADAANFRIEVCSSAINHGLSQENQICKKIGRTERYIIDGRNDTSEFAKNISALYTQALSKTCYQMSTRQKEIQIVNALENQAASRSNSGLRSDFSEGEQQNSGSGTGGDSSSRPLYLKNNLE